MRDFSEEDSVTASSDPIVRRLLRTRALQRSAEELDREFALELLHPESQLHPTGENPPRRSDAESPGAG